MLQDLLFKRYAGAIDTVLGMDSDDFIELASYAMSEKVEEDIRTRWINGYQEISLSDFKEAIGYRQGQIIEETEVTDILTNLCKQFG